MNITEKQAFYSQHIVIHEQTTKTFLLEQFYERTSVEADAIMKSALRQAWDCIDEIIDSPHKSQEWFCRIAIQEAARYQESKHPASPECHIPCPTSEVLNPQIALEALNTMDSDAAMWLLLYLFYGPSLHAISRQVQMRSDLVAKQIRLASDAYHTEYRNMAAEDSTILE